MIRRAIESLARAWLLRPGAEWRDQFCRTCKHAQRYEEKWADHEGDGYCWERNGTSIDCDDDNACPAWRRKEES